MNQFSSYDQLPKFTKNGYMLSRLPDPYMGIIQDIYFNSTKLNPTKERLDDKAPIDGMDPDYFSLSEYPYIMDIVHNGLTPYLEQWCGVKLEPSVYYGIRSYLKGSVLDMHVDNLSTHHISVIIMCEKNLNNGPDWSLDIVGHDNSVGRFYMNPGDMLYYESCKCKHGRPEAFQGEFYRNFYLHYKLKDWKYLEN